MLSVIDITVVAVYAIGLLVLAQWVSRQKAGYQKDSSDYFLAGRALPWWAIGASLIAANISAEQIIGMPEPAWVMGIAIGAYEWMAAITLVIVAKWLLPVFLEHKIYTMPQFLEVRPWFYEADPPLVRHWPALAPHGWHQGAQVVQASSSLVCKHSCLLRSGTETAKWLLLPDLSRDSLSR
jgi:hypothetical protein